MPRPTPTGNSRSPHLHLRAWVWGLLVAVVAVVIALAANIGGSANPDKASRAAPPASSSATSSATPTTTAAPTPPDDPMEDKGWVASDVQVKKSQFGTSITARVTNNAKEARSGLFTLTVFDANNARIFAAQGSANEAAPGQTVTVTFIGTTDQLPGDPATYHYQLQADL